VFGSLHPGFIWDDHIIQSAGSHCLTQWECLGLCMMCTKWAKLCIY